MARLPCPRSACACFLAPEGVVASGPDRVNLAVVLLAGPSTTSSGAGATSRAGTRLDDEDKGPDSPGGDEVIGLGGFGAIKTLHHPSRPGRSLRAGDAGVLIGESHRARGYAAEAMRLAIDWAFTPVAQGGPQLDLVTVTTLRDNAPMIALAERHLGLAGKGVLRPAEGGEPVGEMYYELWPEEWHAMKTAGQLGIRS
ncbi:hypothetical protein HIM_00536 [Hirsutella minnesotensis 3608]|nr:hypothetical protein HIM_00536 [Hirsutella minnesotensis 3608]